MAVMRPGMLQQITTVYIPGIEVDKKMKRDLQIKLWTSEMTVKCTYAQIYYYQKNSGSFRYNIKLEGKYSLESTDPRESEIRTHLRP